MSCHSYIPFSWRVIISSLKYSLLLNYLTLILWFSLTSVALLKRFQLFLWSHLTLLVDASQINYLQSNSLMSSRPIGQVSQYFPVLSSSSDLYPNCTNKLALPSNYSISHKPFLSKWKQHLPRNWKVILPWLLPIPFWLDHYINLLAGSLLPFLYSKLLFCNQ